MTMIKFNPFWEMQNLINEANKFIGENLRNGVRPRIEFGGFKPRVDIFEDEKNVYIEAELPGVDKEDVKISINEDNILTLKGEKKFKKNDNIKTCCRSERSFGEFIRTFQLNNNLQTENINAEFNNGILTIIIAKKEPEKSKEKQIEIK